MHVHKEHDLQAVGDGPATTTLQVDLTFHTCHSATYMVRQLQLIYP